MINFGFAIFDYMELLKYYLLRSVIYWIILTSWNMLPISISSYLNVRGILIVVLILKT